MTESAIDRKRKKARERKQRQRERDKVRREAMGASIISLELYKGTREALQELCDLTDCDAEELLTLLIHNSLDLSKRDTSRFEEITGIKKTSHN